MRTTMVSRSRAAVSVTGVALAAFAVDALAVDEIIVTTRKRAENLQLVPIAVEAISAEEIGRKGLTSINDIVDQSPSVLIDQGFGPQDQRVTIRGLQPNLGRQNVAILQDGVDVSSESGAVTGGGSLLINPRLFDLERVEIVKGPQIALYGRSAFAGAINYITRKPGAEFNARAGTDVGSDGRFELSAGVDGPVTDALSAGLTGMVWTHDGYYDNTLTGQRAGDSEGTSVAGTLVWNAADAFKATLRVENLNDEFGVTPYVVMPFNADFIVPTSSQVSFDPDGAGGPLPASGPVVSPSLGSVPGVRGDTPDGDDLRVALSEDPRTCNPNLPNDGTIGCRNYAGSERDITRATLNLEWDLGAFSVTSLTHYADAATSQAEGSEDLSASTSPFPGEFFVDQDTKLFSQEFRVASTGEGKLSWLAGALFWQEQVDLLDGSLTCLNFSFAPCGPTLAAIRKGAPLDVPGDGLTPLNPDRWSRDVDHSSLFGLVEWQFLDAWKVAFEGRWTTEKTTARGPDVSNAIFDPSGNLCFIFGAPAACPQVGRGTDAVTGLTTVANALGGSQTDEFFAPKLTLSWTPAENQFYYLSFAESFKPKGISTVLGGTGAFFNSQCGVVGTPDEDCIDPIEDFRFEQERLDNYEIGARTDWLDRRLRLNGTFFFQDFKNKQVSSQVNDEATGLLSPRILNAGKAEVFGLELEAVVAATENLTLSAAYTWLDTEYTDYEAITSGAGTIAYLNSCERRPTSPGSCVVSFTGNELEGAPEHALVGNARWQAPLAGTLEYFVEGGFQYQAERFVSDQNLLVFPSYWLADFRAGFLNDSWDLIAYVDNVFDDDTIKTGFEDGDIPNFAQTGTFANHGTLILPDPRTFGLRLNYRFGK